MLELNDVLLEGEKTTLSMMAHEGQLTCLTCDGAAAGGDGRLLRWLHAMLGLEPVTSGFISIDGEPLTPQTVQSLRRLMAFAPCHLQAVGQVRVYEPPTEQEVFALRANRDVPISNGLLAEEARRTGASGQQARLLAVAVLLQRPVLLVEGGVAASAGYLRRLAEAGRTVIATTRDGGLLAAADNVVEIG